MERIWLSTCHVKTFSDSNMELSSNRNGTVSKKNSLDSLSELNIHGAFALIVLRNVEIMQQGQGLIDKTLWDMVWYQDLKPSLLPTNK